MNLITAIGIKPACSKILECKYLQFIISDITNLQNYVLMNMHF